MVKFLFNLSPNYNYMQKNTNDILTVLGENECKKFNYLYIHKNKNIKISKWESII